jgi:hypothetical protein
MTGVSSRQCVVMTIGLIGNTHSPYDTFTSTNWRDLGAQFAKVQGLRFPCQSRRNNRFLAFTPYTTEVF